MDNANIMKKTRDTIFKYDIKDEKNLSEEREGFLSWELMMLAKSWLGFLEGVREVHVSIYRGSMVVEVNLSPVLRLWEKSVHSRNKEVRLSNGTRGYNLDSASCKFRFDTKVNIVLFDFYAYVYNDYCCLSKNKVFDLASSTLFLICVYLLEIIYTEEL